MELTGFSRHPCNATRRIVTKSPLRRLRELTAPQPSSILVWILSLLFATSCGTILIAFGWYWSFLFSYRSSAILPEQIQLGPFISVSSRWLEADQSPLRGISVLLFLMLLALFLCVVSFYAIARLATQVSVDRMQAYLKAIFRQLQTLIRRRSPTLLQPVIHQLVTSDTPAIRESMMTWLRIGPRYLCLMIVNVLIALLINPLLTLLAIIAVLLLRLVYVNFDKRRRRTRPVIYEQRQSALSEFAQWLGRGPLLATVDRDQFGQSALDHHLSALRTHDKALDDFFGWKSPLTVAMIGLCTLAIMFASAVELMRADSNLSVVAILVLYAAIFSAVYSFHRFRKAYLELIGVSGQVQGLVAFLSQVAPEMPIDARIKLPHPIRHIELRDVTLRSHDDEVTIDAINAHLHAGEINVLISDSHSAQSAFADLLLGFGYPAKGDFLIEGVSLSKLGVDRLGELACWVAPDGPILTASVTDNLRTIKNSQSASSDLTHILQRLRCDNAITALPDGLATLISPNDDRLPQDIPFRLGMARALTLQKPIVVVQEPDSVDDPETESATRLALEQLAAQNVIVVVIPSRAKTLWMAHQVLFIQGGRIGAIGKHATLLEQNDAYRHWNYMRFSPHLINHK